MQGFNRYIVECKLRKDRAGGEIKKVLIDT